MASKNKTQLTKELLALGVTEEDMKGKTNAELQALIDVIKSNPEATEEPVEETKDEGDTITPEDEPKDEEATEEPAEEPIVEYEMQMGIHEPKVIKVHPLAKRVVITNVGGGEVLATADPTGKFVADDKIIPGEANEFESPRALVVRSASRPIIKISQFIK